MTVDEEEVREYERYDESVKQIAAHFDIPKHTAFMWEQKFGEIDILTEDVGKNGPENYLDLVSQREWLLHDRDELEQEWLDGIFDWFYDKMDSFSFIRGKRNNPDLAERYRTNRERVRYELARLDEEWIGMTLNLRKIENKLVRIYKEHLNSSSEEFEYKKDKIIKLKTDFPYLRKNPELIVEAANTSFSYVSEFKCIPDEGVANRRAKGSLRDEVLDRDNHRCVSCGADESLQVHHIIPRDDGGENSKENLAVLCDQCHYYAHGGGKPIDDGRYSAAFWTSVEYSDKDEFWNDWIGRKFDDWAPKGFTRVDFQSEE